MICCFSGTGNSRYAARLIASVTGDQIVSLNDRIKEGDRSPLQSERPFVFVSPTYAWRVPRIVASLIRKTRLEGSKKVYFVLTCGDETGNAARYAEKLCVSKGLEYMGLASIVMPENYVAVFDVPEPEQAKEIIRKAVPRIRETAESISASRPLPKKAVTFADRFKSDAVNPAFYRFVVGAKRFAATDACVACGKCAELCPLNNIRLENGKPRWGAACTHCMACICGCPEEAIEYGDHTRGKRRYYNAENPVS